jgi:hypothetical protein
MIYVMNYNDEVIIVRWGGVGWGLEVVVMMTE